MKTVIEEIMDFKVVTYKGRIEHYKKVEADFLVPLVETKIKACQEGDFKVNGSTKHKGVMNAAVESMEVKQMKTGTWNPKVGNVLVFTLVSGGSVFYDVYNNKVAKEQSELV